MIMKDNYIVTYKLATDEEKFIIGNHGSVTSEEMFVPLIKLKMK
ncbi:MAG: hypothetical protein ACOC85_01595 [Thermoplasmatota archaeon]